MSICDSIPEVTTRSYNDNDTEIVTESANTNATAPGADYDREREDIHDEIVSDMIRALMEYIKNTS